MKGSRAVLSTILISALVMDEKVSEKNCHSPTGREIGIFIYSRENHFCEQAIEFNSAPFLLAELISAQIASKGKCNFPHILINSRSLSQLTQKRDDYVNRLKKNTMKDRGGKVANIRYLRIYLFSAD